MDSAAITDGTDAFESGLARLCAAHNVPLTPERSAAYRVGLSKLHPAAWDRLVDHCLGESGPERMPTVPKCWAMYKDLRRRRASPAPIERAVEMTSAEKWQAKVNLLFLAWMSQAVKRRRGLAVNGRSIPDAELHARRVRCRQVAEGLQLLQDTEHRSASHAYMVQQFDRAMLDVDTEFPP